MKAIQFQKSRFLINSTGFIGICLGLYLLAIYIPLISQAGIIVDDWGDIAHNLECNSFWHCYGTWFPLFSNRPLAPLPITAMTFAIGSWYSGYLLINSLIYLIAIGLFAAILRKAINFRCAISFSLYAAIPMIAMPVITSPINQSTATVSFLLWSLSLSSLWHFIHSGKWKFWIGTYVLLLFAFLTYEVILPLLVITAFFPWAWNASKYSILNIRYWLKFFAPIFLVLAMVTLWQKGIAPDMMIVDSRLRFVPSHASIKLYTFLQVFYKQIPMLFFRMWDYVQWSGIFIAVFGAGISLLIKPHKSSESVNTSSHHDIHLGKILRFLLVSIVCLASSAFIFILSDESAVSGGYEARGLSSTWFAFSAFMAAMTSASILMNRHWRPLWVYGNALFLFLCVLSFCAQRDQTIVAWNLQQLIIEDANRLISIHQPKPGSVILGDVPYYLPNNYNNEIVFSQPWDFGSAIALTNNNQFIAGPVIDSSLGRWNQLHLRNGIVNAQNFRGAPLEKFWVYQFDISLRKGTLTQIQDPDRFMQLFNASQEKYGHIAN